MKNKTTYVSISLLFDEVYFHKTVPSTRVYRDVTIQSLRRLMRVLNNGKNSVDIDYHTQEIDVSPALHNV